MYLEQQGKKEFYCGTSNIVLPVPNKEFFPPEYKDKTRLSYYATIFNSVEINSTFYKLPMPRTVEKWASEVPGSFRFTFKLWKEITHAKEFIYKTEDIEQFLRVVNAVGEKKGCLLIQFPASIKFSYYKRLRQLMDDLASTELLDGWNLAVEFRDKSWYKDTVYEFLEHYKAAVVIHDMPKSMTPLIDMERGFIYLRFHGELGDYRGGYSRHLLQEQARYIQDWLDEGLQVYVYFNNTMGEAVHNAMDLDNYLLELL